jgi:DNA modification methylase
VTVTILQGDVRDRLRELPDESVHCVVTSPPYWGLRDYGVEGQIGMEATPQEFVRALVEVFQEVRRVLMWDGTLWLNIGDTYSSGGHGGGGSFMKMRGSSEAAGAWAHREKKKGWRAPPPGLKDKELVGTPWRLAFALQADGWYLRQDIIWSKPNPMPESVRDRCTKAHEYLFLLTRKNDYRIDMSVLREPVAASTVSRLSQRSLGTQQGSDRVPGKTNGRMKAVGGKETRNRRSVWVVPTAGVKEAHFATFPPKLIEPCILAGCPPGGTVLDPFFGAGTTGLVARQHGRHCIGIELNPEYVEIAKRRLGTIPTLEEMVA